MRAPYSTLLGPVSALMIWAILSSLTIPAHGGDQDSVFLMPRDSTSLTIDKASLPLGKGEEPELIIVSWSPPARGALTEGSTAFTYTPHDAFRFKGSDSFRYRYVTKKGIVTATVFLVADLGPGDDDGPPFSDTAAGGDTVLVLDIAGRWTPDPLDPEQQNPLPATRELVRAHDRDGKLRFDLLLTESLHGERTLQARAYENGADVVLSPPVSMAQGSSIIRLDWWSSLPGARNGGLLIRHDDTLVSQILGLDNAFFDGLTWIIADNAAQSPPAAALAVFQIHERTTAIPMAFPPGFADNFEDGTLEAWRTGGPVGSNGPHAPSLTVSADAATEGAVGLRVDLSASGLGATLLDPSPNAVVRYRARFDVHIDTACIGASELQPEKKVVLLAGLDDITGGTIFELGVQLANEGTFRVTLRAIDDTGLWQTFTQPSPISGRATLDVEWWAATMPSLANGGLALRINGVERPWPTFTLTNPRHRIGGIHFGAVALEPGGQGSICLDELESWF